jgi:hypothetical protein
MAENQGAGRDHQRLDEIIARHGFFDGLVELNHYFLLDRGAPFQLTACQFGSLEAFAQVSSRERQQVSNCSII